MFASVARRTAMQTGILDSVTIDDLLQEIYLRICARRKNFTKHFRAKSENAVFAYMKVLAVNTVLDQARAISSRRKLRIEEMGDDKNRSAGDVADPNTAT